MNVDKTGQCNLSVLTPWANSEPGDVALALQTVIYSFQPKDEYFLSKLKLISASVKHLHAVYTLRRLVVATFKRKEIQIANGALSMLRTGAPL